MNMQKFYESIPRGKHDKPMLLSDPSQPILVDINDIDGLFAMLKKELVGCTVTIPFSKPMSETLGRVMVDGRKVACAVKEARIAGIPVWWMGAKVTGVLNAYGQRATMTVSGFVDQDGNEMLPATFTLQAVEKVQPLPQYAAHEKIALQAAEDGIVLLKNNGVLPIAADAALNVFGKGMHEFRACALGAGKIIARYTVRFLEAVRASGLSLNRDLVDYYACGEDILPTRELLEQARSRSDTAFLVISRSMGENIDASSRKGDYNPTDAEAALLQCLCAEFLHVVVILNTGYPLATDWLEEKGVDAILYVGYGGMRCGEAVVNVLTGKVNPSGKLPDTWARRFEDIPSSKNMYDAVDGKDYIATDEGDHWLDTVYEEGIYVGYRYFSTFGKRVGFPFGWGLSYTDFSVEGGNVRYDGTCLLLKAEVINMGSRAGRETVQVYLKKPDGVLEKPALELVEFEKTRLLQPGEMQSFSFCVPEMAMTSFSEEESAYLMEPGEYRVYVGNSSASCREAGSFFLKDKKIVRRVEHLMAPIVPIHTLSQRDETSYPEGRGTYIKEIHCLEPVRTPKEYPVTFGPESNAAHISFTEVQRDPARLKEFVSALTVKELARISICADSGWSVEGTGEAGRIAHPEGLGLPTFVVADGNSGVNLKKRNIGMPSGVTMCATFDKVLIEEAGRIIGEEAKELGIGLILGPGFNIHRNPICGRQPEYFSEDPFLAGKMAAAYARGMESAGVGACYKHFLCNNAETSRKRNQSVVPERALREIYMAAFRYAMEEYQPVSVMTAYNAVNGTFTSEDPELIQGFLRNELAFRGFVMTDWNSYDTASVPKMAAAGNCWITPGSKDDTYPAMLEKAVADGTLPVARLRENVYYLLSAILTLQTRRKS